MLLGNLKQLIGDYISPMNNSNRIEKFNRDSNNRNLSESLTEKKISFKLNDVKPKLIIDEINKNESYFQKLAFRDKNTIESTSEISDILKIGLENSSPKNKEIMEYEMEIFNGETKTNKSSSKIIKTDNRNSSKSLRENLNGGKENTSRSSNEILSKKEIVNSEISIVNNEYIPNEQKISDKNLNLKRKFSENTINKEIEKFSDLHIYDNNFKDNGNSKDQKVLNDKLLKNDGNVSQMIDTNNIEKLIQIKTSDKTEDIINFKKINNEISTKNETKLINEESFKSPRLPLKNDTNHLVRYDSIESFENVYITDKNNSNRVSFEQITEIKKNFTEVTLKKLETNQTDIFEKNEVILKNDSEELEKIKILEEKRKKLYTRLGCDVVDTEVPLSQTNRLWNRKSEFDVFQNVNVKKLAKILEKRYFGIEPNEANEDNNLDLIKDQIPKVPEIIETSEFMNLKINKVKRKATHKRFSFV